MFYQVNYFDTQQAGEFVLLKQYTIENMWRSIWKSTVVIKLIETFFDLFKLFLNDRILTRTFSMLYKTNKFVKWQCQKVKSRHFLWKYLVSKIHFKWKETALKSTNVVLMYFLQCVLRERTLIRVLSFECIVTSTEMPAPVCDLTGSVKCEF